MPYGLKDIELEKLSKVFAANERIERVVLYGSRAKGNYKPFSDVDITLEGTELTHTDLNRISLAIDDLLLPYQFDISIFHTLKNEALIDHIRRMGITIYEKKSEWKEYKLGEIADVQTGPFGSQLHQSDYVDVGIPSIMPVNIGNRMDISTEKIVYITEKDAKRLSRYRVQIGDIVYSRRGDVEKCAYINEKENGWLCGTGCLRIRIDLSKADSKFIAYYLSTDDMKSWISNNAVGTTMPNLNSSILQQIPLSLPTLPTQRRIASILSSLDDKIDLLHRENATLEQMAETLFRQWFVVERKEEWEEVPLEYVCERITDGSHYSPESVEFGLPMASVKDMENWGIDLNSCRKISKEDFDKLVSADCLPQVNDILIAKDGSYLKHIFVVDKMQEVVLLSSIAILRPNGLYHPYLLSILLKLDSTKEELKNIVTGAVIPRIVLKDFRKFPILLPPIEKQKQALSFIEPIMKKCFYNSEQIQTLIQTRDGLLPRLMSGEVKL